MTPSFPFSTEMAAQGRFFYMACLVFVSLCIRGVFTCHTDNDEPNWGDPNKLESKVPLNEYPRDCQEVYERLNGPPDGLYLIKPDDYHEPFKVFCNNSFDCGGWTVFQRRVDGGVDFYRDWYTYKTGFGFLHRDFWLGNDKISYLTNQKDYELRIDLVNKSGSWSFAHYNLFRIGDESTRYTLIGLGSYVGNIGNLPGHDYLDLHRNRSFSTFDADHDTHVSLNCAEHTHGAWWYKNCYNSNLNGDYYGSDDVSICLFDSVYRYQCGIRYTEMKIRPIKSA